MAPTVYSDYPAAPLSPCSLCPLPSPLTRYPLPSHISKFPLIRILRVNPPNSSFHGGLVFSPSAKRTIGWEGQNKRPPCCCFGSWSLFSVSLTVNRFLSWVRQTTTHPLLPSDASAFNPSSTFSLCLEPSILITRYDIHAHMPLWPRVDLFSINKFPESDWRLSSMLHFILVRFKPTYGKVSSLITFLVHSPQ